MTQAGSPTPAPPAKPTNNAAGLGCLVVIGLVVWLAFFRGGSDPAPASAPRATPPAVAATARPAAAVLLDVKGNGIKKSKPFTTTGPWSLEYDFDCSSFGYSGNFGVIVYRTDGSIEDVAVNELATRGHDTTQGYAVGDLYLDMNSECSWVVQVRG